MRDVGKIAARLAASLLHALLNTLLIMLTGKYFYSAWQRFGRTPILESGEALILVAIPVVVVTIVFWLIPLRHRAAGASVVTAVAIVAAAVGSFFLGTNGAG